MKAVCAKSELRMAFLQELSYHMGENRERGNIPKMSGFSSMKNRRLEISENGFCLDGEPFYLASGDMHYFRTHPSGWKRRLELMKDFGLTAVETYVAWNRHEPKKGVFDFSGENDLAAFLQLCQNIGLKVLLRPAPYVCGEIDFGGLPAWLLKDRTMVVRGSDPRYLAAVRDYYKKLCEVFVPYLSTNGGPIIMVAVENEYGYRGTDDTYLKTLRRMLEENGVDVPFFTTDPPIPGAIRNGSFDDCLEGVNYRALPGESAKAIAKLNQYHFGFPNFVGEFWAGRQGKWRDSYVAREPEPIAKAYREALGLAYVNFYMFCGGTNFGFHNGALVFKRPNSPEDEPKMYYPQLTSYDVDAPVSENGVPTEKYFLLRDELDRFLGKPLRPHVAPDYQTQSVKVQLTECAPLFDNLDEICLTHTVESAPFYMEDFGQNFGYILYRTRFEKIPGVSRVTMRAGGVKDYAEIYQNGKNIGSWLRDRNEPEIPIEVDSDITQIDFLVENMGRQNSGTGLAFVNRKGLDAFLSVDWSELHEIETVTLPMEDLSRLNYQPMKEMPPENTPVFMRGHFRAKAGVDTFLSLDGLDHGFACVNGFNIGRYLPYGPQRTLYIPGGLLTDGDNVLEIFELHPTGTTVDLIGEPRLSMPYSCEDTPDAVARSAARALDENL